MVDRNELTIEDVGGMLMSVTQSMFNETFVPDEKRSQMPDLESTNRYARVLTLSADTKIELVCIGSARCGAQLAGKLLQCAESEVEAEVIGDAVGELVNVIAGQVKSFMGTSHVIGLPQDFDPSSEMGSERNLLWQGRIYHSPSGTIHLWMGIRISK